jgi:hypothetical protein
MTRQIGKKIVGYEVKSPMGDDNQQEVIAETTELDNVVQMHEKLERPEMLLGSTYKIKTPLSQHALYVTVNDVLLNEGTEHELRRPFEIFINSKNMDHFQWIVALTRIISAVFRKGGDVTFLVEELRSVFDPAGGYFKKGGKFMPSLISEIGECIETHLRTIGLLVDGLDEHKKKLIEDKKKELIAKSSHAEQSSEAEQFENATFCPKCKQKSMVLLDGCKTCLGCGESRCGH